VCSIESLIQASEVNHVAVVADCWGCEQFAAGKKGPLILHIKLISSGENTKSTRCFDRTGVDSITQIEAH
jgi:hypothetical protein